MTKRALITGITGQDGSYLAEHLLALGYEVHGLVRRVSFEVPEQRFSRIAHIVDRLTLHATSLESYPGIFDVISRNHFDECYHLAAQSFVAENLGDGLSTMAMDINGAHYMLAALHQLQRDCRFYFAGTSEMFGRVQESPQNERTRFQPRSPYGISKLAGYHLTVNYRETLGMFACTGILFNHESPRRGSEFVTRKVSSGVARISLGLAHDVHLGNLDATRDWGHARDYVRAMHLMLQQDQPRDFVIATGQPHSVRDLCERAFASVGRDYRQYVVVDDRLKRPVEPAPLLGDASKAREILGWTPTISFDELVQEMVDSDIALLRHSLREAPTVRT
jgi:GDPmannose 4,6-dehydratase